MKKTTLDRPRATVQPLALNVVAGGAGFIGSHLCRALLDRGESVLCLDNLQTARPSNLRALEGQPRFRFLRHDISQPLPSELTRMAPRIARVWNLACAASPPLYQRDPEHTMLTNVVGTNNLLHLAEAAKAPGTPRKKAAAAGPRTGAPQEPPHVLEAAERERLDRVQSVIVESLEADKAEGVVTIDLTGRAAFTDRMVIATGLADRQIAAMATHLEEKLAEVGIRRVQIEGAGGSDWVLVDAGDIVVHLFKPDARALYALEKMWGSELDEGWAGTTAV